MTKKMKMKSEEKKTKKKEKTIIPKKRRCFSKKNKEISFEQNNQTAIEQLINSLDDPFKKSEIYKDADFKVEFPSDVDDTKFEELFKKGINYAKMKFGSKNLKVLKTILLILRNINGKNSKDDFGLKSCTNDLQKVYRKDLIFTLLYNKNKIEELGKSSQIEYEFKQSIDYEIYIDYLAFNNALLYNANNNNKAELYPFNLFKGIIVSPVILKVYKEVLDELYDVQTTENEIKKICINLITFYKAEYAFIILWTILHENMHILSRLLRKDNNFLLDTDEFTRNKKIFSDESGNYFENKLLLSVLTKKTLTLIEADYLLKKENYAYKTLKEFQSAFIAFRKLNNSQIKSSQSFAIGKESDSKSFPIKIGCSFAGERKSD